MTTFTDGFIFGLGISVGILSMMPLLLLVAFAMHEIEKRWKR